MTGQYEYRFQHGHFGILRSLVLDGNAMVNQTSADTNTFPLLTASLEVSFFSFLCNWKSGTSMCASIVHHCMCARQASRAACERVCVLFSDGDPSLRSGTRRSLKQPFSAFIGSKLMPGPLYPLSPRTQKGLFLQDSNLPVFSSCTCELRQQMFCAVGLGDWGWR